MAYKILAIDDHPETLDIVVATLRSNGYNVVGSRNPLQGLAIFEKVNPDLVLVDMNMPQMDGKDVVRRIRTHPKYGTVPIIMFTAEGQPDQKMQGFEAGVDDYLMKPTEPEEMLMRIESMLASVGKPPLTEDVADEDEAVDNALTMDWVDNLSGPTSATMALAAQEKLIAVLGTRGGAGATTVAINLAMSTALMGQNTILADMDMIQGHVALYLNQAVTNGGLNALAQIPETAIRQQLPRLMVRFADNLQLLLTKPNLDGRFPSLSTTQTDELLDALAQPGRCVVADVGRGITENNRQVIDRADHVLLCLGPERVSLSSAKILLNQLRQTLFPHTTLSALVFSVGSSINLPQDAIQSYLGHPLLGIIAVDLKQMARAANKGVPLVQLAPEDAAATFFRQLTNKLVLT
ncbi:MAG: response regulator [Anaerolineales bacterium]|nr:response regulator [Anaerolineales bacterium]